MRDCTGTNLTQHPLHLPDLLGVVRVGSIHHVDQQVGIHGLLQCGFEGVDEPVRQVTDKTHRIRQGHGAVGLTQIQLAGRRVQRGKQLVGGICARFDQCIEQGGLARVGVAHQ